MGKDLFEKIILTWNFRVQEAAKPAQEESDQKNEKEEAKSNIEESKQQSRLLIKPTKIY